MKYNTLLSWKIKCRILQPQIQMATCIIFCKFSNFQKSNLHNSITGWTLDHIANKQDKKMPFGRKAQTALMFLENIQTKQGHSTTHS